MKLIYLPKNGERHEFDLGPVEDLAEDMTTDEAELVEDAGQLHWRTFGNWQVLLGEGGFRAWRVMLWILLRRQNPQLDLNQVKPVVSEMTYQFDPPATSVDAEGKDVSASAEPDDSGTDSESPAPDSEA